MVNINGIYQDARDKKNPNRSSYNIRQKDIPHVAASVWITYGSALFSLVSPIDISFGVKYTDQLVPRSFGIPEGYVPGYNVFDKAMRQKIKSYS